MIVDVGTIAVFVRDRSGQGHKGEETKCDEEVNKERNEKTGLEFRGPRVTIRLFVCKRASPAESLR